MTEQTVHPFIKEFRVGTTERITSMDPLTKEFADSIHIPSTKTRVESSLTRTMGSEYYNAIIAGTPLSKLSQNIPKIRDIKVIALAKSCTPWNLAGLVPLRFNNQTAYLADSSLGRPLPYERAELLMNFWKNREPDFVTTTRIGPHMIKVTLINVFTAIPDKLSCYSFIIDGSTSTTGERKSDIAVLHIWNNREYHENSRLQPMYFEWGGSMSLYINAAISALGFKLDACGGVHMEVNLGDRIWSSKLSADQVAYLRNWAILPNSFGSPESRIPVQMQNSNLEGLGYSGSSAGRDWLLEPLTNLPWQVRTVMVSAPTTLPRGMHNSSDFAGVAKKRAEDPENSAKYMTGVVVRNLWRHINEEGGPFTPLLTELRTEILSRRLIQQTRESNPGLTGTQLLEMFGTKSKELSRFDFERNLPKVTS